MLLQGLLGSRYRYCQRFSGVMRSAMILSHYNGLSMVRGSIFCLFMLLITWLSGFQDAEAQKSLQTNPKRFILSNPPIGLFEPIEISPSIIPSNHGETLSPAYPIFPDPYEPVLTGKCIMNFSSISSILDRTALDCSAPLAALVGNVICCPQVNSLLHIFQGGFFHDSDILVLNQSLAEDCFSDIISILASRGANNTIPTLCSVKPSNLTGGSCPIKDLKTFEKRVNTSKLLDVCSSVDPLKECCKPACQTAIKDATLQISLKNSDGLQDDKFILIRALDDCKGVVYSWLSRKLSLDAANTAFRLVSGCKVNRVCPLEFNDPAQVIKSCKDLKASTSSCCSSLNTYIEAIQGQMLITNKQAIHCATLLGSMLQKGGVANNIYELCHIDLKDFSLQAYGQQGCLLRSLPEDVVFDNSAGISFTCDLSDNIAAPWPLSTSVSSLSLCAGDMSLPALPASVTSANPGLLPVRIGYLIYCFLLFLIQTCS